MSGLPAEILTAPLPVEAFSAYKDRLAQHHGVTRAEVDEALPDELLTHALGKRRRLEELWPDTPQDCHIYAAFCRSAGDYFLPLPEGAAVQDHQANWPAGIPWSYIASPVPLDWPQLELLRRAFPTVQALTSTSAALAGKLAPVQTQEE